MNRMPWILWLLTWLLLILVGGCEDDRVAEVALEAADRQAAQNETMAGVTRETAEATKQIVAVHGDLQAERRELSGGWNDLEAERRQIAAQRRTESALAMAVRGTGVVLIVLLTLGVAAILLLGERHNPGGDELVEMVLQHSLGTSVLPAPPTPEPPSHRRLNHHPEENP